MLRTFRRASLCGAALALALCSTTCHRHPAPTARDGGRQLVVQVPAALRIARGLDTLSVQLDPDMLAKRTVRIEPHWSVGVAYTTRVFVRGTKRMVSERHGYVPLRDFDLGRSVWRTGKDGIPQRQSKYLVEMKLVLFETDVPPGPHWNPHAGHFRPLLSRTLQQAEE